MTNLLAVSLRYAFFELSETMEPLEQQEWVNGKVLTTKPNPKGGIFN